MKRTPDLSSSPRTPSSELGRRPRHAVRRGGLQALVLGSLLGTALGAGAATALSDAPVFSTSNVPGNLVMPLSVEFPTAVTAADSNAYVTTQQYLGYFDPKKCYSYRANDLLNGSYFYPDGATGTNFSCSGKWSGNFMNWATMQAVDPFRWALTGGYRSVDTVDTTILEKAFAPTGQGSSASNFPHKSVTSGAASLTPFTGNFYMRVVQCGTRMLFKRDSAFAGDGCPATVVAWDGVVSTAALAAAASTTFSVQVRVQVCTTAAPEANCKAYGSNYKPEGLIQQNASKIRFSAFGYLNDPSPTSGSQSPRDGGVMRARMKFVGPTQPVPGSPDVVNAAAEWSATTGQFVGNPDTADALASSVSKSGVINYLNQFGLSAQAYKRFDPVSELYYAATRYLRAKGNVPNYSDLSKFNGATSTTAQVTAMKDGFPVIQTWDDPILYSCQKNFVLGLGDTNTWTDKNVPGNESWLTNEPNPRPIDDIDAVAATNKVGVLEGIGTTIGQSNAYNIAAHNNSAYMAGLAYLFHTTDIRTDATPQAEGKQTIATYWLDVLEGGGTGSYKAGPAGRNQFYLTAKYGGFKVPEGYSYETNTTALATSLWSTNGETLPGLGARPDNFFVANAPDKMVAGLRSAFADIAAASAAYTTSFSSAQPQVSTAGNASFSAQYDPATWTGEVQASELTFTTAGVPSLVPKWSASAKLEAQLAGSGWDTGRRVVTWNGTTGVAFRAVDGGAGSLTAAQLATLDTPYDLTNDSVNYLNYLRGDRTNELTSTVTGSTKAYRTRAKLLGDVVDASALPVGPPNFPWSDSTNPGYSSFKDTYKTRPLAVYVGANDGMLHVFNGALTGADAGKELYAYVPSALFAGPTGSPQTTGLASLGVSPLVHHYLINATPITIDVDLGKTWTGSAIGTTTNWRSLLIGGLGKGGRSYYALDITGDPTAVTTEALAAAKVLWEFTAPQMGYSLGEPTVAKTRKYGWTVIFTSGYNSSDGKGYLFFVNPRTGALLETVTTDEGTLANDAGLAQANAYILDSTDGYADAVYAGDLLGNLWRFDLTGTTGSYPAPTKIAVLSHPTDGAQPVTTRPLIRLHPTTRERTVLVGTGKLLSSSDIGSTQMQSFYAIQDGNAARFNASTDLPAGVSFPIPRSKLVENADLLVGYSTTTEAPMGFYFDFGKNVADNVAWRLVDTPQVFFGTVALAPTLPNSNACSPSGTSRIYALDFDSGVTSLTNNLGEAVSYVSGGIGVTTDLRFFSVNGKVRLISGTDRGELGNPPGKFSPAIGLKRLNWREIPLAN